MSDFLTVAFNTATVVIGVATVAVAYAQLRRTPKPKFIAEPEAEAPYAPSTLFFETVKMREPDNLPGHWR
ncbi:MAG: hypothetical protein WC729_09960 [Sphingomonas sp.]|uniref:hypothetical protein n=1 Tax=Sphingomonas sp. TaxID=28214 RepID=UPI003566DC7D